MPSSQQRQLLGLIWRFAKQNFFSYFLTFLSLPCLGLVWWLDLLLAELGDSGSIPVLTKCVFPLKYKTIGKKLRTCWSKSVWCQRTHLEPKNNLSCATRCENWGKKLYSSLPGSLSNDKSLFVWPLEEVGLILLIQEGQTFHIVFNSPQNTNDVRLGGSKNDNYEFTTTTTITILNFLKALWARSICRGLGSVVRVQASCVHVVTVTMVTVRANSKCSKGKRD